MTLKEIKDLWFNCYGEDLKTEYSGFYKKLEKLERQQTTKKKRLKNKEGKMKLVKTKKYKCYTIKVY